MRPRVRPATDVRSRDVHSHPVRPGVDGAGYEPAPPATATAALHRQDRHDFWVLLALVLPNAALIVVFAYRPVIENVRYSLLNWTLGSPSATFVGWATTSRS